MPRITQVTDETATPAAAELLADTRAQLGRTPNLYRTLVNSPAALRGYLDFREALTAGVLPPATREKLALLVAQRNECDYCIAAHNTRGKALGLTAEELQRVRRADDADPHTAALLTLAAHIVDRRGAVDDADVEAARAAGVTDEQIAETVAHVALNTYSNMVNHLAEPDLDFPAAEPLSRE